MNKDQLAARLLATFTGEIEEQLRTLNGDLLALEAMPGDADRLKSVFRVAHTLKGAARAAGVPLVEQACHALESLLAEVRGGKRTLAPEDFALLFAAADALADAGKRLRTGREVAGGPLAVLLGKLSGSTPIAASPAEATTAAAPSPRRDGQVRIDTETLDALLASAGQRLTASARVAARQVELEALHEVAQRRAAEWRQAGRRLRAALARVTASPAVTQAVTGVEQSFQHVVDETSRLASAATVDARALAQTTDEVVDRARRLRMRPFAEACEALPRTVRDLASAAAKDVQLTVEGGDVQADRAVLDGLREALLHLVRNAVDHGIEAPAARERAGKPRRGTVRVAAALRGDRLAVVLSDDGAGLDLDALRDQLRRRGVTVPPSEREVSRLLFEGGLTTRTEPTEISGRGVGLELVRAAIDRLGGTIDVEWTRGSGTVFTIECPLSLATVRAVLVSVGSQTLAVPTAYVERLVRVRQADVRYAEGRALVVTSLAPVPLVSLAHLLPPLAERPLSDPFPAVILASGERRLAVAVDELLAEQEIVVQPLEHQGRPLPHLSGGALLGSGRVALALHPPALIATGLEAALEGHLRVEAGTAAAARRRILVVDDSITTRTLEESILEAAGYDVVTAVDGADGWRSLQEHGCELVVADVEMPRMDGFALCEAIRGSKRYAELPIVLVTAMETPEHRARGLEVGADAYIGKSSFDQQGLLDVIRQLLG